MNLSLAGRNAWVSGATRGIGRACAVALAHQGANVVVAGRNSDALRSLAEELPTPLNNRHNTALSDHEDPNTVQRAIEERIPDLGTVHILINNSGGPPAGPIVEATNEDFVRWFSQHLLCNHVQALAVIPGMKSAGWGRIVNIVSTSVKQPIKGLGVSNTVRGAVASWAKTLSSEVARFGITVNNVLPGATATDRLANIVKARAARSDRSEDVVAEEMQAEIPAGRFGKPEEIAACVAFLASPAAAYVTGVNLPVDGGRTDCL